MTITVYPLRPDQADDLSLFTDLTGDPTAITDVRAYVDRTIESGAMRPEWCYLASVDGRVVGRAAAWTLPPSDVPLDLVLLDVPWNEPDFRVGAALLRRVLADVRSLGGERVGHVVDEPPREPFWQDDIAARIALLEQVGFRSTRETTRFELRFSDVPPPSTPLTFRDLAAVGEPAFVDAIRLVSDGTLDQEILEERERDGPEGAARLLWDLLVRLRYEPGWWQLAYDAEGALVGLVMPCANPGAATIGYIGVVPEQRGNGYVDDLMAQVTRTLHAVGYSRIVADTDLQNAPMAAAFARAGYTSFGTRKEFAIELGGAMQRT